MEEAISGFVANVLTLILVLPTTCILRSWLTKEEIIMETKSQNSENNTTDYSMDIELIRKQFVTYMSQKTLSVREIEVAWFIYRGYTNLQIAQELFISEKTVKKHATHIYEKLNITNRKELKEIDLSEKIHKI